MRSLFYAALLLAACPIAAFGQTADELLHADKTPQNVLTYGMSYSQQRFSPLKQINRNTVKRLVPAWSYSMNNNTGEESQPLIYNGVMYITSQNRTVAVDAMTGKEIWNTPVDYPPDTTARCLLRHRQPWCCDLRGQGVSHHARRTA